MTARELIPAGEAAATLAEALVEALDLREHETGLHSARVACHTLVLARRVRPDPAWLHQVYWGSLLHDVGKIGLPDSVLLKRGRLDEEARREMRTHPEKGFRILSRVPELAHAAQDHAVHALRDRVPGAVPGDRRLDRARVPDPRGAGVRPGYGARVVIGFLGA